MTGIISTIGPATWNEHTIKELNSLSAIMRFNGSWIDQDHFQIVKKHIKLPIIIDIPGERKKLKQLTLDDNQLLALAVTHKVDYIGISYVKGKNDIEAARRKLDGSQVKIIAKIETKEALENLNEILSEADMIMIDRGDLGTAIGFENVPKAQMDIIKKAKEKGKKVIVATEMMMSTINSTKPNCADVSDVYYAVAQGADYIMLSEETAIGKNPLETVRMMKKIIDAYYSHNS